jgi:uncharacterized protein (TIGR03437 family)
LTLLVLVLAPIIQAQTAIRYTITTLAGTGSSGYSGDSGAATAAQLSIPYGIGITSGSAVVISDQGNRRIRQVGADGTISTVAGTGTSGSSGDGGTATSADLNAPTGVAVDSTGTVYFADSGNHVVRKFTVSGTISTVAGQVSPGAGFAGDGGAATSAELDTPIGVAVDSAGNLYICDTFNNRVRKVGKDGNITTFAGDGAAAGDGDGGPATNAALQAPSGVAVDGNGNVYIADTGNNRIRKVTPDGNISTIAGNGAAGYSGDLGSATAASLYSPEGVAVDSAGYVYIADTWNSRIRRVSPNGVILTIAGNGRFAYGGDGGEATSASLSFPRGIAVDAGGKVYFADTQNNSVRVLTPVTDSSQPPAITAAKGAGAFGGTSSVAPGSWIEIYGSNLALTTRSWTDTDFNGANAPTVMDGTSVAIGGQPAVVSYISGGQINALVPANIGAGDQPVIVTSVAGTSAPSTIRVDPNQPGLFAPSQFNVQGQQYAGAEFADGSAYALPAGGVANVTSRPAKAGETLLLFGTGFGPVVPDVPYGQIAAQSNSLTGALQVFFGNFPAIVTYAGLAPGTVGLYQFNVTVPAAVSGAVPVTVSLNGAKSNQQVYVAVQ